MDYTGRNAMRYHVPEPGQGSDLERVVNRYPELTGCLTLGAIVIDSEDISSSAMIDRSTAGEEPNGTRVGRFEGDVLLWHTERLERESR